MKDLDPSIPNIATIKIQSSYPNEKNLNSGTDSVVKTKKEVSQNTGSQY